jgi:hypothetical protein
MRFNPKTDQNMQKKVSKICRQLEMPLTVAFGFEVSSRAGS